MFTRTYSLLPLVAAAAICGASNPAMAADAPTIKVTYSDLNLHDAADVSQLYQRIRHAAAKYCRDSRSITGSRVSRAFDACMRDAIDTTVQKISRPELSAFHASHAQQPAENS